MPVDNNAFQKNANTSLVANIIWKKKRSIIKEWALLGFSYNLLQNEKLDIENVWLCNPPRQIYEDVKRNYASDINEHTYEYPLFSDESLKQISDDYSKNVVGQTDIVNRILPEKVKKEFILVLVYNYGLNIKIEYILLALF